VTTRTEISGEPCLDYLKIVEARTSATTIELPGVLTNRELHAIFNPPSDS